jgi:hypothetical protein
MARGAIHPGEDLAEQLEALKMSAAELARQLKVPTNLIATLSERIAARKLNRRAGFNFFQWDEGAEWDSMEIERCQRPRVTS